MNNEFKILEIVPDAKESDDHIATAYLKVASKNNFSFWVFVPSWKEHFPYFPRPSKWGVGSELINNLMGRKVKLRFSFVDLEPIKNALKKEKKLMQGEKFGSADNTQIIGKVVKKEVFTKKSIIMRESERVTLDCGVFEFDIIIKKNQFQIGDFIKIKGMLQTNLLEIN